MTIDAEVIKKRSEILRLAASHGARNVRVFGSASRGDNSFSSDVDFLVDFEPGRSLLDLGALLEDLQELLGREVDLVTERALHWYVRNRILNEATLL